MTTHDLEVDGARWLVVRGLSVPGDGPSDWWVYFAATGGPSRAFVEFRVPVAHADAPVTPDAQRHALQQVLGHRHA